MSRFSERFKALAKRLKQDAVTIYLVGRHPRTPWLARVVAVSVAAYALSPIDLIPDFIPVLGYLDDLVILPLGIALAVKLVPDDILEECRYAARERVEMPRRGKR